MQMHPVSQSGRRHFRGHLVYLITICRWCEWPSWEIYWSQKFAKTAFWFYLAHPVLNLLYTEIVVALLEPNSAGSPGSVKLATSCTPTKPFYGGWVSDSTLVVDTLFVCEFVNTCHFNSLDHGSPLRVNYKMSK